MKKVISLILICTIIISSSILARAKYKDINLPDAPYVEEIDLAVGLGLMTPTGVDTFSPEQYVTRGEFMNIVSPLMGVDISGVSARQLYPDVTIDSPYASAITEAYDLGVISENVSGFYPNRNITFNEAIKIMIHILGYEYHANLLGEYPLSYLSQAAKLGIMKGLTISGDKYMSRGEAALFVVNCLETEIYSPVDGNPPLMERMGLSRVEGRMTANSRTTLTGEGNAEYGKIAIEFVNYNTIKNYDELLGYNVVCYYESKSGKRNAVYVQKSEENKITSIAKDDISSVSGREISYGENDKTKKITIPGDVYVIYNYFPYKNYPSDVFDISSGRLELLDNNSDGKTDIVFVYEYTNHLVSGVDINNDKLYAHGRIMVIDETEADVIIDADTDERISLDKVKSGELISLFSNPENGRYTVYVNHAAVEGVIETIGENSVTIGSTEYKTAIINELKSKLGTKVRLLLDCEGIAFMIDENYRSVAKYGYILNAGIVSGLDTITKIRLMTEESKVVDFTVADNVDLDGTRIKGSDLINELSSRSIVDPSPVSESIYEGMSNANQASLREKLKYDKDGYYTDGFSMLIKYNLNSDGKISKIDTPQYSSSSESADSLKLSGRYPNGTYQTNMNYRTETRIFMGAFGVDNSAKVFFIPETLSARKNYSEDLTYDFGVDTISCLKEDTNYPTSEHSMIEAYNFDDCNVADVIVFYVKVPDDENITINDDLGKGYPTLIIEEISDIILPSGEIGKKLTGTGNSGQITLNMSETFYNQRYYMLIPGNIIGYQSIGGQLSGVKLLLSLAEAKAKNYQLPEKAWAYRDNPPDAFSFGQVESCDDNFVLLYGPRRNVGTMDHVLYGLKYIYIYDTVRNKVRKGNSGDIRSIKDFGNNASDLFVFTSYGSTRLVVIYE